MTLRRPPAGLTRLTSVSLELCSAASGMQYLQGAPSALRCHASGSVCNRASAGGRLRVATFRTHAATEPHSVGRPGLFKTFVHPAATGLQQLRELNLGWCHTVGSEDVQALSGLTRLTALELARTRVRRLS